MTTLPVQASVTRAERAGILKTLERHLERTVWSKGGAILSKGRAPRVVATFPGATPAQIKAGSRKLFDRLRRDDRVLRAEAEKAAAEKGRRFEIGAGPGDSWTLILYEDDEEMGGGQYPADDYDAALECGQDWCGAQ